MFQFAPRFAPVIWVPGRMSAAFNNGLVDWDIAKEIEAKAEVRVCEWECEYVYGWTSERM